MGWHAVYCTVVMSSRKMSTLLLLPSKPSEPFNSLTGVQLVLKSVSITNHQLLYQVVIWLRFNALFACYPTLLQLLKLGLDLIINSILCMLNVLSFTGMS